MGKGEQNLEWVSRKGDDANQPQPQFQQWGLWPATLVLGVKLLSGVTAAADTLKIP